MSYQFVDYQVRDRIATLTLDRPDALNAFTHAMGMEMVRVMDEVDGDDEVRALVITGAGRAFCAGADLSEGTKIFENPSPAPFEMEQDADYGGILTRRFFASTKPIIGAINGAAVGMGVTMTLPMDVRLASTSARFGFVFARRGLVPEAASSFFLPRIVGISQAAEWVYSGRVFGAEEALQTGLVRSLHAPGELLPAATALAKTFIESSSAVSVAVSRRMLWEMLAEGTPELAHELDSRGIFHLGRADDVKEGVASFLEKRPPVFPMRVSTDLPQYVKDWQRLGSTQALIEYERAQTRG
jgi:enoyl-CoA hydratase/carnithine racemase